jgi:glycosyltransferase involved in cell wall biosynthesis
MGKGAEYLRHSLNMLRKQTFKDFEVVVSDDSKDGSVESVCKEFADLNINYSRNDTALGISGNTNKAMSLAKGDLIKVLFMDDYLFDEDSLKDIDRNFAGDWFVSACEHAQDDMICYRPFFPRYNHLIHTGLNTISSPSVLTVRNEGHLTFDENLIWLMDCDYYKRCFAKFGPPTVSNRIGIVNRISEYQTTSTLKEEVKRHEVMMLKQKYV